MMEWVLVVILYSSNIGDINITRFNTLQECENIGKFIQNNTPVNFSKYKVTQCIKVQPLGATK